jgi:hypothetical protein
MSNTETLLRHIFGLDLGKQSDPTSLVVVEQQVEKARGVDYEASGPGDAASRRHATYSDPQYLVRHIDRPELGTEYRTIARQAARLLRSDRVQRPALVLDANGVGDAVVEILEDEGVAPVPIYTTGGREAKRDGDAWTVPKNDIVTTLQALLQDGRLQIAEALDLAPQLVEEMQSFSVRYTESGQVRFEHSGEGHHGDTVIALALAVWWGEQMSSAAPQAHSTPHSTRRDSARSIRQSRQNLVRNC